MRHASRSWKTEFIRRLGTKLRDQAGKGLLILSGSIVLKWLKDHIVMESQFALTWHPLRTMVSSLRLLHSLTCLAKIFISRGKKRLPSRGPFTYDVHPERGIVVGPKCDDCTRKLHEWDIDKGG